jgi:predicted ABC-type ATPase
MFAGPNGSGKSTLKTVLPMELLGVYLNPDEIESQIRRQGFLAPEDYGLPPAVSVEMLACLQQSSFLQEAGFADELPKLRTAEGRVDFSGITVNSYFASVTADALRRQLLTRRTSFTLETVMSSPDKVSLLQQARELGYRTYLYFIATEDPAINISRVRNRAAQGGHSVPEDKIISRYHRSLDLLMQAIRHTNRAYLFDNSGHNQNRTWLAEINEGRTLEIKADQLPAWFVQAVLSKIAAD